MYTDPELRERLKRKILREGRGGLPNEWSARKAQLLVRAYEASGGSYLGKKTPEQASLSAWTKQKWRTKSGRPSILGPEARLERYLPAKAITHLSPAQYARTTRAKRLAQGQFSHQPPSIAEEVRPFRRRAGAGSSHRRRRCRSSSSAHEERRSSSASRPSTVRPSERARRV